MNQIINTQVIINARNYLLSKFAEVELSTLKVYPMVHPSKNLPSQFVVVKTIGGLNDIGNVDVDGTLEFCLYALNLNAGDDQTQPDLMTIHNLTQKIVPILNDAVFENTAITAIRQQIVSHSEIKYFYNSLVCQTINLKS
ncbi:hypothetical protein JGH11_16235 [Dysgonomonas sp. Marseille-P4677]|uniref:hypothetical protein n=1 Tax=Dysgonomonas sp. Marseille-P4677 TaxID=2364790 RepID=UPI0019114A2D|nr:hypothetical protein [Dysgonomonas sp. Marseille-P4677]MBK5722426.1 hypothetical protein [Dysgonomonas sp. Marseille-P4677]